MIPCLSALLLLWIPRAPAPAADLRPVMARFEQECLAPGGRPSPELQAQLEQALYQDLLVIELGGKTPERRVLKVAARAELPQLAAFALRRLERGARPEDAELAAAGLESPYPAVRSAALQLARALDQPRLARLAQRGGNLGEASRSGLVPTRVPEARQLGAALYPKAAYSYAASRADLAVFQTADAPDKVIAFFGKGKRVLQAAELRALQPSEAEEPDSEAMAAAMMQAVMSGKDPQALIQEMQAGAQARQVDWTHDIEGVEGIQAPRFVVLEVTGPRKLPTRVVAVYRDEALGATAVAYRLLPTMPAYATGADGHGPDPAYLQALQELQMRRN